MELNAIFKKVPEGYVAFVEELPGANSQGGTLEEARTNLQEAIKLTIEANRYLVSLGLEESGLIREQVKLSS